ncbi:MAG: hypothetical protein A3K18_27520 [Lentisphaerae bacterium RIFOXYA12_64_32]|nr:MAG: hypothetical protein A3K18_27520 [Lentisphaerae bacterium RIFOXYA12_64_32]
MPPKARLRGGLAAGVSGVPEASGGGLQVGLAHGATARPQAEEKLCASEALLRAITDTAEDAIFVKDAARRYTFLNPAAVGLLGRPAAELLGKTPEEIYDPDNARIVRETDDATFAGNAFSEERTLVLAGRTHVLHSIQVPLRAADGTVSAICGIVRDITARKAAEDVLRESEARYRLMAEAVPMMAWRCAANGEMIEANSRWCTYTGQTPAEARGQGWSRALHPDDAIGVAQAVAAAVTAGEPYHAEYRLRRASDGEYRWHLGRALPLYDADGKITAWFGATADIDEQKRAADILVHRVAERTAALNASNEELQRRSSQLARLASELTLAEHRERRRLAEFLHDHLQQLLVGACLHAEALQDGEPDPVRRQRFEVLTRTLQEAIESSRSVTRDLTPPILLDLDLDAALQWLGRDMRKRHNLRVTVRVGQTMKELPETLTVLLFSAARELLLNVLKHAGTGQASMRLRYRGKTVEMEVSDKGAGFDPAILDVRRDDVLGFGLFSIRERTEVLGGTFTLESGHGAGTRIGLTLPIMVPAGPAPAATETTGIRPVRNGPAGKRRPRG